MATVPRRYLFTSAAIVAVTLVLVVICVKYASRNTSVSQTVNVAGSNTIVEQGRRDSSEQRNATAASAKVDNDQILGDEALRKSIDEIRDFDYRIKNAKYTEISPETLKQELRKIEVRNASFAGEEQLEDLYRFLEENILAYKLGEGQRILDSVLRAEYSVLERKGDQSSPNVVVRVRQPERTDLPKDPVERLRYEVMTALDGQNGDGYTNLYKSLSAEGSSITIRKSRDAVPLSFLDEFERDDLFVPLRGAVGLAPHVRFAESPEEVVGKTGELLYADIRLAATDMDDKAYSRVKRMYWAPGERKWLPMEVVLFRDPVRYEFF